MTKKKYMKPAMQTVELRHRTMILTGSSDAYGMNKRLVTDDEVDDGW